MVLRYPRIPGPRVDVGEIIPGLYQRSLRSTSAFVVVTPPPMAGQSPAVPGDPGPSIAPRPSVAPGPSIAIVDAGWRIHARRVLNYLGELGYAPDRVQRLISTHYHLDHIGGMAGLQRATGVRVDAHHIEVPNLRRVAGHHIPNPVQQWWLKPLLWPAIAALHPPIIPNVDPLHDGDLLPLLGGAYVVHTPGHTPGSISLHFPNEGALIVADALQRRGNRLYLPSRFFSSDMDAARESVRKLAGLDFDTICFSHFLPMRQGARAALRSLAEYVS